MLRFGTIGSGWITDEYIHGAKDSGLWELTAVYSRTPERGWEYAKKHGAAEVFTDIRAMAASDCIDAVYIASPNVMHYEHCKAFLENGKHVICEKPLCAQAEKAAELYRLAEKNHVIFLEAIMFLHLPQRKLLEDALKKIGDISMAKIDFCQRSSKLDTFLNGELPNIFNPQLETGALMDLGVYCVYPALHFFGKPQSFHIDTVQLKSGADGCGVITMRYLNRLVTLTYSKLGQAGANTETLCGDDEKYRLMGWEAKDFYRYITEPEKSRAEYQYCVKLSIDVAEFLEEARKKAGIRFPSDPK